MNLFNELKTDDIEMIHTYLKYYADVDGVLPIEKMNHYLRYWEIAKQPFYQMFGNKFITKKEVRFDKSVDAMAEELYSVMRKNRTPEMSHFLNKYEDELRERIKTSYADNWDDEKWTLYHNLNDLMYGYNDLVNNCYSGTTFVIDGKYLDSGRSIQVSKGCKIVKMLGKICKEFGIAEEFEHFRLAHSQVLNQKRLTGTLCLSVHPLDYITMSDNDCGWTSCMAWVEDRGDYRIGTVEMMNSPCVVVAYLEASDPYQVPCGFEWSNKKWRQLYIVNKDIILGNKQYPYENDELQGFALNWLKDMASSHWGIHYSDTTCNIINGCNNTFGDTQVYFDIHCDMMYNDVYGKKLAYMRDNFESGRFELNFSGPAICAKCGDMIGYDTVDTYMVVCSHCDGHWYCERCEEHYSETEESYSVGGMTVCSWCRDDAEECECCGELTFDTTRIPIVIGATPTAVERAPITPWSHYEANHLYENRLEDEKYLEFNKRDFGIYLCDNCYSKYAEKDAETLIRYHFTRWGMDRTCDALDIKKLPDKLINTMEYQGQIDEDEKEIFFKLKNAKTLEEEQMLINELLY
jgi:hypothetical protein